MCRKIKSLLLVFILLMNVSTTSYAAGEVINRVPQSNLKVSSSAFCNGSTIPQKYGYDTTKGGENKSIPIEWSGAPRGTQSYALAMYDLFPLANNYVHWAVVNIPASVSALQDGASKTNLMPGGSIELLNSAGTIGYEGPCPPKGTGSHQYRIMVFALNTEKIDLSGAASLSKFLSALEGKILAQGEVSGIYPSKY